MTEANLLSVLIQLRGFIYFLAKIIALSYLKNMYICINSHIKEPFLCYVGLRLE